MPSPEYSIIDNKELSQFELRDMGPDANLLSFATYALQGNIYSIPHVETDPARRGEGFADLLMEGILDYCEVSDRRIIPICAFAREHMHLRPHRQHLPHAGGLWLDAGEPLAGPTLCAGADGAKSRGGWRFCRAL